jgi:tetratricopeptide (TPR) repeat protein
MNATAYRFRVDEAIDQLQKLGLVDRDDEAISLHRLVQSGFLYKPDCDTQSAFENAAFVLNHAFPKQIKGRWLYGEWDQCQANVQHVLALAQCYKSLQRQTLGVMACENFVELLTNCAWFGYLFSWNGDESTNTKYRYLDEIESQPEVLDLMEIAKSACSEKRSLWYAHLLNTEAMSYFSLNNLGKSRQLLLESMEIREALLPENDEELGNTYNNLGIVESGEGRLDNALDYYKRANETRTNLPEAETSVATSLINTGRALFLKKDYAAATENYAQAKILYERNFGADSFPMQG